MQQLARRWASSISNKPLNLRETSATLLPPIPLFRHILRAHRFLPLDMRSLGDSYVKSEFRRHREVTNPVHIMGFLAQWKLYLDEINARKGIDGGTIAFKGRKLDPTLFEKMSAEQIGQLYELMHTTKNLWNPITIDPESEKP